MNDRRLFDDAFRKDLVDALGRTGELCIVVCYARAGGMKDWYLAQSEAELEMVVERIPTSGQWGYSDRVEAYATDELPDRAAENETWLRERASEVLERTGEVVLACRRGGDPALHDVEETNDAGSVVEWFLSEHEGQRLVGPHPFRHDANPDAHVLVAYNAGADGAIRPGAY